jgi:hypothetical protein
MHGVKKNWLAPVIVLLMGGCPGQTHQPAVPSNAIAWKWHDSLSWSDYQGTPKPGTGYAAMTRWFMYYRATVLGDSVEIEVRPYFLRDSSWVDHQLTISSLLTHEKLHFDIAEVIARNIRAYFHRWQGEGVEAFHMYEMHGHQSVWKDSLTTPYDLETDHGRDPIKQLQWNHTIEVLVGYPGYPDVLNQTVFKLALGNKK